jgi:hypothetical protein
MLHNDERTMLHIDERTMLQCYITMAEQCYIVNVRTMLHNDGRTILQCYITTREQCWCLVSRANTTWNLLAFALKMRYRNGATQELLLKQQGERRRDVTASAKIQGRTG